MKVLLIPLFIVGMFGMDWPGRELVEIVIETPKSFETFLQIPGFDRADFETISPEQIIVWITSEQKELVEQSGFRTVPADDISAKNAYLSDMQNYTYQPDADPAWDQYCDYDCMTSRLGDISKKCGYGLVSTGKTVKGRDIWVMTVGSGDPTVLMAANIHGDEPTGGQLMQRWLWETCNKPSPEQEDIAKSYVTAYMPMFNADGFMSKKRSNANGKDLNRDFPAPGQTDDPKGKQTETVAMMAYVTKYAKSLKASVMYHGGALVCNYPYDSCYTSSIVPKPCPPAVCPDDKWAVELANAYAKKWPSSYKCLTSSCIVNGAAWYQLQGSIQDYNYFFKKHMDITIEVSKTKWVSARDLPNFYKENLASIVNFIKVGNTKKNPM